MTGETDDIPATSWPNARREVVLAAAGAVVVVLASGLLDLSVAWPVVPVALVAAVAASVVDLRERRLPNRLLLPASAGVAVVLIAAAVDGEAARSAIALAAGASALLFYGLIWWLRPSALGYGDVKLAGLLGMATGWLSITAAVTAVFVAFIFAALVAVVLLVLGRARSTEIPFGPFMTAGALVAVVVYHIG